MFKLQETKFCLNSVVSVYKNYKRIILVRPLLIPEIDHSKDALMASKKVIHKRFSVVLV